VVVAGVAYAGSTWGRITGVDARSGRVVLSFPHGEYVPVSGNGSSIVLVTFDLSRDVDAVYAQFSGAINRYRDVPSNTI